MGCVRAGEALGYLSFLESLDLSWNSGVGGGALQSLLGKPPPSLRELHLVSCQLTAADAAALGTDFNVYFNEETFFIFCLVISYISHNASGEHP